MNYKKIFTILIPLLITSSSFGQSDFYFKKWKSKQLFSEKYIVFQIDTSLTRDDAHPIMLTIDRVSTYLKSYDFDFIIIPFPSDTTINKETLMLRFDKLPNAYVQLKGTYPQLPLCSRMEIKQPNSTEKRKIETKVAISIPNFESGLEEFGVVLATKLMTHFEEEKK